MIFTINHIHDVSNYDCILSFCNCTVKLKLDSYIWDIGFRSDSIDISFMEIFELLRLVFVKLEMEGSSKMKNVENWHWLQIWKVNMMA